MDQAGIRAQYRRIMDRHVGEAVLIRRFQGTGRAPGHFDHGPVMARPKGYAPEQLVGAVKQGDVWLIVLAEDIEATGIALPITREDRIVLRGRELAIEEIDGNTRSVQGVVIAWELRVRG